MSESLVYRVHALQRMFERGMRRTCTTYWRRAKSSRDTRTIVRIQAGWSWVGEKIDRYMSWLPSKRRLIR